jgi:hypothetical protein
MTAIRAGSAASVLTGTLVNISLQFKLLSESLEVLSNMENSDKSNRSNHNQFSNKQETCEGSHYRNCHVSAKYSESVGSDSKPNTDPWMM